jgi:MoxR-like ATPase
MAIKSKIIKLLQKLNDGVIEKEEVIALSLLSSVAGESIFLLGAPGVAKSLIARRLKYAYKDGRSFEYLMNRFSTPDEIFGPVSISKLKDQDKYERIVTNYLPSANVIFLDEIWKAGPSIQNALLTVLNEKIYRNGEQEIKVPIKALISASNELPGKGEGLEALWDRFLIRLIVDNIKDQNSFNAMISSKLDSYSDTVSTNLKITDVEYQLWDKAIDEIEIPENVFNVIYVIRNYIEQHNQKTVNSGNQIYISDRRWRKIVRLLRTSAFLNDRKAVDLMDCFLIKNCLWNETSQIQVVALFVRDAIQKFGYQLNIDIKTITNELKKFDKEVKSETSFIKPIETITPKEYVIKNNVYYRALLNGHFSYEKDDLIEVEQLKKATKNSYIEVKRWRNDLGDKDPVWIKLSKTMNKIYLSNDGNTGNEFYWECDTIASEKTFSRKPNHPTKIYWDKKVSQYLVTISNLKSQIEIYKENDLKHLRVNMFVNPDFASIVESNLTLLEKEIEIIEVEIYRIQHYYENIDDQTESLEIKSLSK